MDFILILIGAIGGFIIGIVICLKFIPDSEPKDPKDSQEYMDLLDEFASLKIQMYKYQHYINILEKRMNNGYGQTKIVREVPKGTLDAVKLAMKLSHPDNGGNKDDFVKYRRAYNILIGKEKPE